MSRFLSIAMCMVAFCCSVSRAHPSIDNSMEVIVHPSRVMIAARIALPQIDIEQSINDDGIGPIAPELLRTAIEKHAPYLAANLHVKADGKPLIGRVIRSALPEDTVTWEDFDQHAAVYELEYVIDGASPKTIDIDHELLSGFTRLGQGWAVNFMVRIRQEQDAEFAQRLLTLDQPVEFACTWDAPSSQPTSQAIVVPTYSKPTPADTRLDTGRIAGSYLVHGLHHILTGYDHLLFVAALVLAATKLWDLVKVVTAFAVAHTLTLTLSVLNLVRLDSSIVEPVIAGSIVFVALQNALFPRQSQGKARLAIAFVFGLFHGLGFAGGLLEAMEGMPAINLVVALLAFTLGVEIAHQILIVPLFFVLKFLRTRVPGLQQATVNERAASELGPPVGVPVFVRLASVVISVAGMVYFIAALSER